MGGEWVGRRVVTASQLAVPVADPGGGATQAVAPPIGLEKKKFRVKEIISYGCASSARQLICIYLL